MREDDDIPVLTELAVPAPSSLKALNISSEQIDEMIALIKPQLDTHIQAAVQNEVKQRVDSEVSAVLDKARADWATEVPRMMKLNAEIISADLEKNLQALQQEIVSSANQQLSALLPALEQQFTQQMQATAAAIETSSLEAASEKIHASLTSLREEVLATQQSLLTDELTGIYKSLTQHTQGELAAYLEVLQKESIQAIQQKMDESFPALYENLTELCADKLSLELSELSQAAKREYLEGLKAEFPAVEEALNNKVHEILGQQMPEIESSIAEKVRADIESLLESVRLVFGRNNHH